MASDSRFIATVGGVCFLTSIAAVAVAVLDSAASVSVVALVSTNILALLGTLKSSATHAETLRLTNGGLAKAIQDALTAQQAAKLAAESSKEQ